MTDEITKRRTFAIISHPDAGKTTLTEKLLLFGGAIALAGTVKGRKASRHATSDWMELEKQRGISVTTSVMQFPYKNAMINLLDTPGHGDFSEDTYRTLTAVDSALMVIDAAKGVEERTIKLLEVCRLRNTPIITFINKLDRETREPIEILDEIETVLKIKCAPMTWPIGTGRLFQGTYHLYEDKAYRYEKGRGEIIPQWEEITGLANPRMNEVFKEQVQTLRDDLALVTGASHPFNHDAYLRGQLTPVFFGSALSNFGIRELLDSFIQYAPPPLTRETKTRAVLPNEPNFSGFVFKIQANMDPQHRDRIAFMRICSGHYQKGMKLKHLRLARDIVINQAVTFMASTRDQVFDAWAGDIIGLHNHGTIQIGDTFTEGEPLQFTGIPYFAPELFKVIRLNDPLKAKALHKGLLQLSEEGATQFFKPLHSQELIVGAVGPLQFDVVAYRLQSEYHVACRYETANLVTARWVTCKDPKMLEQFKNKNDIHLALDASGQLVYLAPSMVHLNLTMERWPEVVLHKTREHQ